MTAFVRAMIVMLNEMAIYLLIGFLLAGMLHALLQARRSILRPLEGAGSRPVFLAALIGVPLSLCSCAVLPTGVALMRRGVRKGAAATFLITVPETDIVTIFLTYGLIGPLLAVFRPVAALVTGIGAGLVINLFDRRGRAGTAEATAVLPDAEGLDPKGCADGCGDGCGEGCGDAGGAAGGDARAPRPRGWLGAALRYGFVDFFDDLLLRLLLGIAIGAAIAALIPPAGLARFAGNPVLSYAAMLAIGIPLFVCASASIPIAAGLMVSGFSPGAVLVFLLAGPATNVASILVLVKEFGRLVFAIYLGMIAAVAVAMGLLLDLLVRRRIVPVPDFSKLTENGHSLLGTLGTVLFLGLALWSLWRRRSDLTFLSWLERRLGLRLSPRALARIAVSLAVAGWLCSGFFSVRPGERAVTTRFGAVSSATLGPGLHYHWPAPVGGFHRAALGMIRRVEIGFRSGPAGTSPGLPPAPQDEGLAPPGRLLTHGSPTESWMLTGDENIIDIQAVAQYQVEDSPSGFRAYLFGVEDPDQLVRVAAVSALQEAIGGRSIDSLLTSDRAGVEHEVRDSLMQPALDAWGSGIRVVDLRLVSVHAPTPVHWAFRDVASAAEDAAGYVNQAREYAERVVREAEGDSARGVLLAQGEATRRVWTAQGDAAAFTAQSGEYRKAPGLTRSRLYLEKLDAVLPGMNLYIDLTRSHGSGPSIWVKRGPGYDALPGPGQGAISPGNNAAPGAGGAPGGGGPREGGTP